MLGLISQFPRCPVRHRSPRVFRWFAGQRDDLRNLLGRELGWNPGPGCVGEGLHDRLAEDGLWFDTLDDHQAVEGLGPASSPQAGLMAFAVQLLGNLLIAEPLKGQANDGRMAGDALRTGGASFEGLQEGQLSLGHDDLSRRPWPRHNLPRVLSNLEPREV